MADSSTRYSAFERSVRGDGVGSDGGPSLGVPVAALAFANLAALAHPNPLVIAVLSAILVFTGFLAAAVIGLRRRHHSVNPDNRMIWPALIVFFGFVGTIFSDTDRVVQMLSFQG